MIRNSTFELQTAILPNRAIGSTMALHRKELATVDILVFLFGLLWPMALCFAVLLRLLFRASRMPLLGARLRGCIGH